MTDQERKAIELAESIQAVFEEHKATADERYAAIKIASAMLGLASSEISPHLSLASHPA